MRNIVVHEQAQSRFPQPQPVPGGDQAQPGVAVLQLGRQATQIGLIDVASAPQTLLTHGQRRRFQL